VLKVYNTLTGEKEEFISIEEGKVGMYVCGLTVQNYSHIGHTRSAINYDVIKRYLEYKGYDVLHIQNFTDVNEKIVARAKEENMQPFELAEKYTKAYMEDIDNLNIKKADIYPRATDNINEIIEMVHILIDKSYAYEINGDVYFSIEKFLDYGKLSGRNIEQMQAGARIEINEDKRHPMDFALWKRVDNEVEGWDSPWGKGWPGWHIECSAMSIKYLGNSFDIHGGGTDLIFPHHENEIAQSEAYSGVKPFVKYWLHNGSVNFKGEKMSKSLGNFYTTREILKKFSADEIRYFLLTKHYHNPIDFSIEEMEKSRVSLRRLINTSSKMEQLLRKESSENVNKDFSHDDFIDKLRERRIEFEEAMDDDFNSALAIGVLHELARDINFLINNRSFVLDETNKKLIKEAYNLYHKLAQVFGLTLEKIDKSKENLPIFNDIIDFILKLREEARREKNWQLADQIRNGLAKLGVELKDTPHGVEWEFEGKKEND
jgi:cysteinyl-tRNA synthetase